MVKILVVDDEIDIAELLVDFLTHKGYSVEKAHTGSEALSAVDSYNPEIVLLDIKLPDWKSHHPARVPASISFEIISTILYLVNLFHESDVEVFDLERG